MSDKDKLNIACELLRKQIKKSVAAENMSDKWKEMALQGSIQSRKAKKLLVRSQYEKRTFWNYE